MEKEQQGLGSIKVVITVIIVLLIAGGLFWYSQSAKNENEETQESTSSVLENTENIDIGAKIYEEVGAPGVIPESAPAVPNPIQGLYKNPFE